MTKITTEFGGEGAEGYNVMRSAMRKAAEMHGITGEYAEYELFDELPRTSLTIALVDAIRALGYDITKKGR